MTRLALAVIAAMGALVLLGRRLRVEPAAPAPIPDDIDRLMEWVMEPRPVYATAAEWSN